MNNYWQQDPPMSFVAEGWDYGKRREFRYAEVDYLLAVVDFPTFKGKRVLCVGEGGGIDAAEFARNGAIVSVIDASPNAIDLTKRLFADQGLELHAVGDYDACEIPFEDARFDAVYCLGVLHHIKNAPRAVAEAARVLAPGGTYLGLVYNADSLLYAYSILARGIREGLNADEAMRAYSERRPGCPFSRAYTKDELSALLSKRFSNITLSTHYDVIDLPDVRKVRFRLDGQTDLGWHLFFKARKGGK